MVIFLRGQRRIHLYLRTMTICRDSAKKDQFRLLWRVQQRYKATSRFTRYPWWASDVIARMRCSWLRFVLPYSHMKHVVLPGSGWSNSGDQALAKLLEPSTDKSVIANHWRARSDRVGQVVWTLSSPLRWVWSTFRIWETAWWFWDRWNTQAFNCPGKISTTRVTQPCNKLQLLQECLTTIHHRPLWHRWRVAAGATVDGKESPWLQAHCDWPYQQNSWILQSWNRPSLQIWNSVNQLWWASL